MSRMPDYPAGTRLLVLPVAAIAVATLATACSSSKSTGNPATSADIGTATSTGVDTGSSGDQVEVKNFAFSPDTLKVKVGTKVTWKFDDDTTHTVKADNGSFQSSGLSGGKTFSFTFAKAGQYKYICSIHPSMKGQITVQ
jgi:plastocyanin